MELSETVYLWVVPVGCVCMFVGGAIWFYHGGMSWVNVKKMTAANDVQDVSEQTGTQKTTLEDGFAPAGGNTSQKRADRLVNN